ncbi:hypothetical protein [Trueperella abortisuis]|uniref:hypothetical protein n=1 Tax=Trueperella abortisuis TaxID=445930 RepID=UPI002892D23E|nr:hypothetical protein [Trueperella abortisuis]
MIISFADRDTEALYLRQPVRWLDSRLHRQALRKLRLVDSVVDLNELRIPPGNRLEALKGPGWPVQHKNQRSVANLLRLDFQGSE